MRIQDTVTIELNSNIMTGRIITGKLCIHSLVPRPGPAQHLSLAVRTASMPGNEANIYNVILIKQSLFLEPLIIILFRKFSPGADHILHGICWAYVPSTRLGWEGSDPGTARGN